MSSAVGRARAHARRGSAPSSGRRTLATSPAKSVRGPRVVPRPALGALGFAALTALAMTAAGVDPIKTAAARDAPPLGFLASGPGSTTVAVAEAPAIGDVLPTAPDRLKFVLSLSGAMPQNIRPPAVVGRLLTLTPVPPGRSAAGRVARGNDAAWAADGRLAPLRADDNAAWGAAG